MSRSSPASSSSLVDHPVAAYELRFCSLFDAGRALAFPCDAHGRVDENHLSEQARHNYQRARKVIGKDWATPLVRMRTGH